MTKTLDVEAIEADARQRTGHPRFGCIPAWAWRGAILAASATDEGPHPCLVPGCDKTEEQHHALRSKEPTE